MDGAPGILNKTFIQAMLIVTAAINGIGAGILWVAQGNFVSCCACDENLGFLHMYFWAFFMGSQISGNVIAGAVLESGADKTTLFIVFAILAVVGSCTFLLSKAP
jgi:MFS family permease